MATKTEVPKSQDVEENLRFIELLEQKCWLSIRTVLRDGDVEIQDLIAFIGKYCLISFKFINFTSALTVLRSLIRMWRSLSSTRYVQSDCEWTVLFHLK